ncbi:hypothetical protein [uncultured Enterovirga sp.]|uniref:hypothetical protein n=1 Tax=uncultured Enterovirga sp. TaxID=2026352 RepID=UPI0035C995E5
MTVEILTADSITKLGDSHRGHVIVSGSHGGVYAGYCAAKGGARAVVFNDAGAGRDRAGIESLGLLDGIGLAAATADVATCRIGDAADMLANGIVSHVSRGAAALGCGSGQSVADCAELMRAALLPSGAVPDLGETRFLIHHHRRERAVIGIDSASLFRPEDAGCIVVTASHGGRLGGRPDTSVPAGVFAATFHDAGGGKDGAGWMRLADLDSRGTAAVTVSAASARIGDARSCYEDGVLSHLNALAIRLGGEVGLPLRIFVERLVTAGRITA